MTKANKLASDSGLSKAEVQSLWVVFFVMAGLTAAFIWVIDVVHARVTGGGL